MSFSSAVIPIPIFAGSEPVHWRFVSGTVDCRAAHKGDMKAMLVKSLAGPQGRPYLSCSCLISYLTNVWDTIPLGLLGKDCSGYFKLIRVIVGFRFPY